MQLDRLGPRVFDEHDPVRPVHQRTSLAGRDEFEEPAGRSPAAAAIRRPPRAGPPRRASRRRPPSTRPPRSCSRPRRGSRAAPRPRPRPCRSAARPAPAGPRLRAIDRNRTRPGRPLDADRRRRASRRSRPCSTRRWRSAGATYTLPGRGDLAVAGHADRERADARPARRRSPSRKLAVMCWTSRIGSGKVARQRAQDLRPGRWGRPSRRRRPASRSGRRPRRARPRAGGAACRPPKRAVRGRMRWRITFTWLMIASCVQSRPASAS